MLNETIKEEDTEMKSGLLGLSFLFIVSLNVETTDQVGAFAAVSPSKVVTKRFSFSKGKSAESFSYFPKTARKFLTQVFL